MLRCLRCILSVELFLFLAVLLCAHKEQKRISTHMLKGKGKKKTDKDVCAT